MKYRCILACILGLAASQMVASSFEPIYTKGSFQEKNNTETEFTILRLKADFSLERNISDLAEKILSAYVDIVCIQGMFVDTDVADLYEILESSYAHFIYEKASGLLIASRLDVNQTSAFVYQYTIFSGQFNALLAARDRNDENKAGASLEGGGRITWGGREGVEFNFYVKGEAHDDYGNYIETNVEQNHRGEGGASLSGGYGRERD